MKQSDNKLSEFGLVPFLLTANTKVIENNSVCVAMVETIKRRLEKYDYKKFIQSFDLLIIDEAHKCSFDRIFNNLTTNQYVIGATATPYRSGKMPELKEFYDKIINVCQVKYLVDNKFLSSPTLYGVPVDLSSVKIKAGEFDENDMQNLYSSEKLYTGLKENIAAHCKGEKILIFAPTIATSKLIVSDIEGAKHFDCYMNDTERNEILNWFETTDNAILSNVGILTTGFDCPTIQTIILYRATKSLPLYLQMCGRGSRVTANKSEFKIMDFGNNLSRFGYWENDRDWSLENDKKPKKQEKKPAPVKNCPSCDALLFASAKTCKYCGYEYPDESKKESERIFTILEKLTPSEVQRFANDCNVFELEEIRKIKNFKLGWICHKLKTYNEFLEYEKLRGFKKGWAKFNYEKYGK